MNTKFLNRLVKMGRLSQSLVQKEGQTDPFQPVGGKIKTCNGQVPHILVNDCFEFEIVRQINNNQIGNETEDNCNKEKTGQYSIVV